MGEYEEKIPDLECEGDLTYTSAKPGEEITGSFMVENVGEDFSLLDWEITEWPEWGDWTFSQLSGYNLQPEDGQFEVEVKIIAPEEKGKFTGEIRVENKDNPNDYEIIDVMVNTPKNKAYNYNLLDLIFARFPILRHIIESFIL